MKFVRRKLLAIVPAVFLSILNATAQAASWPTLKATKLGQRIVFQGYTYICIKSKGKLIWKKGAKVVATPATSKPTSSSATSQTPAPITSDTPGALVFVAKSNEVSDGEVIIVEVRSSNKLSFPVSVTRVNGAIVVVSAICTHQGCQLESLKGQLGCSCHGSAFSAVTGAVAMGPANSTLKNYTASEDGGSIFILA